MTRMWDLKKQSLIHGLYQCADRSRVLSIIGVKDLGPEIHAIVQYQHPTLVRNPDASIVRKGPVVVGVRYSERILSEAPHPLEIAAVFAPSNIFHPNLSRGGLICLGHPTPGLSMEQILHTLWAALTFNMKVVNPRLGEVLCREAAEFVIQHRDNFPLTEAGLFEAEPGDCSARTVWS